MCLANLLIYSCLVVGQVSGEKTIIDLNRDFAIGTVKTSDAKVALVNYLRLKS